MFKRVKLFWIRNKKWAIRLFWVNILIWFWPLYLGHQTYKDLIVPQEVTVARIERINYQPMPKEVGETIDYYSNLFGVDSNLIHKLVDCESKSDPTRLGDYQQNLLSVGLFQFQPTTFYQYAKAYKVKNANLYDYRDQTIVAIQMIRDGKIGEWTCSRLIK